MPELPEVETVCRGLSPVITGARLDRVTVFERRLRWPVELDFEDHVQGTHVRRVWRRAKYIVLDLDDASGADQGHILWHLGMSGRVSITPADQLPRGEEKHDHFLLVTDAGHEIVFNDARRFGSLHHVLPGALDGHRLIKALGPEPLSNHFSGPVLKEAFARRATSIKQAIMDQAVVVGVGNIYASESLYRAGIHPRRKAGKVSAARLDQLAGEIKNVLREAIEAGGSTLKDHAQVDGELGYFQHAFKVYGRDGADCLNAGCDDTIRRDVQGGRATFYCPSCQR